MLRVMIFTAIAAGLATGVVADETPSPPRAPFREAIRTFAADGRYLLTFPARTSARGAGWAAGFLAASALAMNRDVEIRDQVIDSDSRTAGRIARTFEPLGRLPVEAAALGAFYLTGRAAGSVGARSAAATAFESYLWAGIAVSVVKAGFGRERPGSGSGEGRFFAGDTIFPSGHTCRSFAIAAVVADRGGRGAAWIAYTAATLTGLSTVQEDLHWGSDVVAGAGLGLAIGRGIASRHPGRAATAPRAGRATIELAPLPGGAAFRLAF